MKILTIGKDVKPDKIRLSKIISPNYQKLIVWRFYLQTGSHIFWGVFKFFECWLSRHNVHFKHRPSSYSATMAASIDWRIRWASSFSSALLLYSVFEENTLRLNLMPSSGWTTGTVVVPAFYNKQIGEKIMQKRNYACAEEWEITSAAILRLPFHNIRYFSNFTKC